MDRRQTNWDHYRTALAVLDEGTLSGAARVLGLTQPTIGRQIEVLEQALGVTLFTRSHAGLQPTEAALALKPYAQVLRSTAGAIQRTVTAAADQIEGTVRITASEIVAAEVLPPILAAWREQQPGLGIELVLSNKVEDLLLRDADIAVRMVDPRQESLIALRVGAVALGLHAHKLYLDRHPAPTLLAQLGRHSVIGFDAETPFLRKFARDILNVPRTSFALRTDSDLAQLAAIRAGYGIGVCQVPIARRDPGLVRILPSAVRVALPVWLVMHESLRSIRRYQGTFDALAAGLRRYLSSPRV